MSNYKEIEVKLEHVREGVEECSQKCAVALALMDSDLISNNEWAHVSSANDIYKEFQIGNEFLQIGIDVHPGDIENVGDFLEWFDGGERPWVGDKETLQLYILKFRAKLEDKYTELKIKPEKEC